jgi:hypothetical protein
VETGDVVVSLEDQARIAVLRTVIKDLESKIVAVLSPYVGDPPDLRMLASHDSPYPVAGAVAVPAFKTPHIDGTSRSARPKQVCFEYADPPGVCRYCVPCR